MNYIKTINENQIFTIKISSPSTLNALNSKILSELNDAVDSISEDVRVLIITGDGEKSFVAGADISEMSNLTEEEGYYFGKFGASVFKKIEDLAIPVIAAINGFALGGGCELAIACDIRVASDNALFGQPEVKLGIIPGFSGTVRLAKLVGQGIAKELIYTGRNIKADEALRIGLVNSVTTKEDLMPTCIKMAQTIVGNSPIAVALSKESVNRNADLNMEDAIELENSLFGKCFATEDQKEGMSAFLEKRKAEFKNK